jgi:uncharacterized surface protein with fasciclin (FAS1) repeats
MEMRNVRKLSLVAAAVAVVVGSSALAQDDDLQTEEVRRAAEDLERAEDRLEVAEEAVEEREEEFEESIAEADEADPSSSTGDVSEWDDSDWDALTEEHANLGTFVEALRLTGLDETLSSGTAYTVFAPTDEAFDAERDDLLSDENREELIERLRAHIVADDVDSDRARTLDEALTVDGGTLDLSVEDGELMVGDARVVESDIRRRNLRIYTIDELLEARPSESSIALIDEDED